MRTEELAQIAEAKRAALALAEEEYNAAQKEYLESRLADAGFKVGDIVKVPESHYSHKGKMCRIEGAGNDWCGAAARVTILKKDGSDSSFADWIPLSKLCKEKEAPND